MASRSGEQDSDAGRKDFRLRLKSPWVCSPGHRTEAEAQTWRILKGWRGWTQPPAFAEPVTSGSLPRDTGLCHHLPQDQTVYSLLAMGLKYKNSSNQQPLYLIVFKNQVTHQSWDGLRYPSCGISAPHRYLVTSRAQLSSDSFPNANPGL